MMGIGARGGKKDRKITFRNLKRNKKKEEVIEEESKKKELKKQNVIKKQENIIQITKEEKEQEKEELIDLLEDAPTLEKKNGNMKEMLYFPVLIVVSKQAITRKIVFLWDNLNRILKMR